MRKFKRTKMNNNLKLKNKFNTYQRFTDENGLQQYKNGICIDHYLGVEMLKLKPKEIETLIAYNKGELWWSEVEPTTASDRARIAKAIVRYNDWHPPSIKAWDDIVSRYGKGYHYPEPTKSEVTTDYSHYGEYALLCAKWNRLSK